MFSMQLSDFNYDLPPDLIAQEPVPNRETSRMLVVNRRSGEFSDEVFRSFPERFESGDVLVLNNTKVFPARLFGHTETGARVEVFLIKQLTETSWEALGRPARRLIGKTVTFAPELRGKVVERLENGHLEFEFEFDGDFDELLGKYGGTPLPPYIKRSPDESDRDRQRYQTVYAKSSGAIAAPTAGLHFTDDILAEIRGRGVEIVQITLHVGYGTFEPVRAEDLTQHSVLPERFEIGSDAAAALNQALSDNRRIVAVGTTTTRALESAVIRHGQFIAETGMADLTVTPGYRFKAVQALLTNFHLPQSSLLILVSTFGGHKLIMDAYRHAVSSRYRFYSYGDCMFIE